MKSYVPHTAQEREAMLQQLGLSSLDELYKDVPEGLRLKELQLPPGRGEAEVRRHFAGLCRSLPREQPCFRGAGAYSHYIPAAVTAVASRPEFVTAYTPYQAEMSQGMLQAIFEYQTMVCQLTGLEASNASVYDGATAAAEAMHMLAAAKRSRRVLASSGLHPDVLATLKTYARFSKVELVEVSLGKNGLTDREALKAALSSGAAGFIAAQPNFFGLLEDMQPLADLVHEAGSLFVAYVNPISLGLLKRPGEYGADIAVGDGQPLGLPLSFGGPYLGFMACTAKLMRNLPGRIAGQTADAEGNTAYVLTLQAREQHIRREKAGSNICSNQMLCAITASAYLACMGPEGLKEVASQCLQKAHYLAEGMAHIKGFCLRWPETPFFHEFAADCGTNSAVLAAVLKRRGIMGGLPLSRYFKGDAGTLWCATEQNTRQELDELLGLLEEVAK